MPPAGRRPFVGVPDLAGVPTHARTPTHGGAGRPPSADLDDLLFGANQKSPSSRRRQAICPVYGLCARLGTTMWTELPESETRGRHARRSPTTWETGPPCETETHPEADAEARTARPDRETGPLCPDMLDFSKLWRRRPCGRRTHRQVRTPPARRTSPLVADDFCVLAPARPPAHRRACRCRCHCVLGGVRGSATATALARFS